MSIPLDFVSRLTRRLLHRTGRRDRKPNAENNRGNNPSQILFETLEPRLLLAADPLGITAGYAFDEVSRTTTADASGHGIVGPLTNGPTFVAGKSDSSVARDDVRIAEHALTQAQIQTDMVTPLGATALAASDTPPNVSLTPPPAIVSGTVNLAATASDDVGIAGVKFLLDTNTQIGLEDTTSPYGVSWNTTTASNGTHFLAAQARDAANNVTTSTAMTVIVDNQAPTGTVVINGGAAATNNRSVTLTLSATDAVTSVTQMRFSNSGTSFSTPEPFATTKAWTLSNTTGTKTVYVQFADAAGNWSTAVTDTIVLDRTAPTISGRTATNITGGTARITWTTNEPATSLVEYGLTTSYGSSTALDPALVTAHSVTLTGLAPNTTYNYRVHSTDAAGNERISANSTFRTAAAPDTTPPSVPTGLTATAISSTQINLSWNASTDNVAVTGYQVFRNGTQVGPSTTTTFSDTGLSPSTSYSYTVRAVDASTNPSGQSQPASATTLTPDTTLPTATITAPTGSVPISGMVTISANASDNVGVSGVTFLVDNVVVGGGEDATSPYSVIWDTTTVPNGVHTIMARARDTSGNLGNSVPVSVTVSNTQQSGLVAAYSFDEGAGTIVNDSSGQGNAGTLNNGVAWVPGKNGRAASFDGVNDYIAIPNSASTNISGNALTLSMWINPQPLASGDSVVIGKFWNTTMTSPYYQYGLELGGGNRTDFFVGTSSGQRGANGGTTLPFGQWTHLAITFDGAQVRTYVNGTLVNTQALSATITARGNAMNIGADASLAQFFHGMIDDLRIYNRVLTPAQIQTDMTTPVGPIVGSPQVSISSPASGARVGGIINVTADATDDTGIANVQFYVDNVATGSPDTTAPYVLAWDTRTASNGVHTLAALATDIDGHSTMSAPVSVNVANSSYFQNTVLATGFNLPTAIKFLPDGRMLVVELAGTIKVLPPPYTTPDATPFLKLTNIGSAGVQQGIYDIALDPNFATNHYYYIFYTLGTPNVDRLSRFTANATLTGTIPGSEFVIYQDGETANAEHHGGAINFSNDGKILVTTGEHFNSTEAQDLTKPRGKILRFNMDGTIPTDNPFYDGPGPNYDAIWALGLRNPYRAYYDAPTGRLIIGDVGGNDYSTAIEEVDIGARGANYGWPNVEAPNGNPAYTAPAYYYPHNGRDASITGGFVYHGTQFPAAYQGSYFFADYAQNWIKRLTFDANGNVTGVFNFEPADGSVDGPYGDIVYLTEGPDGALYYVDLGYSDTSGTFGVSKIRRIEFIQSDLPPVVEASASPRQGQAPLTVNFSSNGSSDPEGQPLSYSWNFGDGTTSTQANPSHTYTVTGPYQARLAVSDGVNSTLSAPIAISVGNSPVVSILAPTNGATFRAGDVITFSGIATDAEDGTLPASAYTWNIDFLHEGHVHPGIPITGVTSGSFTIPTSGHDFSGFTRYQITLTVTDSSGLQSSQSVTIFPDKVNLDFNTLPAGVTLYLDGIAHTTPFTYDTLIGFNHEIEARNATIGTTTYNFVSWSDGGAQDHIITVPAGGATYTATYQAVTAPAPLAFVQVNSAVPQTNQTQVSVVYTARQVAGDMNILVVGWNNTTSNVTSVADSAGNVYQLAVPTVRGNGISQAIYYAKNIKPANAGANTVTVTFDSAAQFVDLRALEYSGLDTVNPFDVGTSASGTSNSANSGTVTTSTPHELIFGAGYTIGAFNGAGSGFTTRIITDPDADIAEDRFVTATGSYSATAPLGGSAAWVMQVATFKAAS